MFPSPIIPSFSIINRIWPTVGNILSWIWLIKYLKLRFFFADLVSKFFNCKTYCPKVVGKSVFYLLCRCLHNINCSFDGIIDIHHRKASLFFYKTCIFSFQNTVIEDCNGIISGSSSWFSFPTDNSWISYTSYIQTKLFVVISS